ncbi:hypothetical protein NB311A_08874 [Nitrobacter sp. Nb-311A]|uniref:hypothetical protein n=1 Tax=Nitrobacter sp. Nb-311A TaxID=314253 RepID=UPI0000686300|nr:hypothetical protein [Nitrobacter sp. Nb-311A]EAQ33769.1 hypothetical protein NB311A_08874 [Nitrobacter sp. Nb-311A]
MKTDASSPKTSYFTWGVFGLTVALLVVGIARHGFSLDVQQRFWTDMFARVGGPMTFRFFLQPTMAAIAALHDGLKDARQRHKAFFWARWFDRTQQTGRLREGITSVSRVLLLGVCMDVIYQFKEQDAFYPAEAAVVAILLAVVPYFVFRWIVETVVRRWFSRRGGEAS